MHFLHLTQLIKKQFGVIQLTDVFVCSWGNDSRAKYSRRNFVSIKMKLGEDIIQII